MTNKTAIIIGATGLVGSHILRNLLSDERYTKVLVFHRRSTGVEHPKLTEHIINFDDIEVWKHLIKGDELFSALGTTIKDAGSEDAQYKIDYHYQLNVAEEAANKGVRSYALVSSIGANPKSRSFYTNMKGELDNEVQKLGFDKVVIARPSFLKGERQEERTMEKIGIKIADALSFFPFIKKYRPIHADIVAKALIKAINSDSDQVIYESDRLFDLAG